MFEHFGNIRHKSIVHANIYSDREANVVSFTDSAIRKLKDVVEKEGTPGDGIRIYTVPGG